MRSALTISPFLMIALFVGSCATSTIHSSHPPVPSRINLSSALKIQAGKSTKVEINSLFGAPDATEIKNGHEMWMYFLPETGSQRLTVTFGQGASVAESVLWVPQDSSEGKLSTIQSMLPQAKFQIMEPEQKQHFILSDLTYVDQERRISILSQKNSDQADAVAWRAPESRQPSAEK